MILQVFILSLLLGSFIGYLIGSYSEWDTHYPINKALRQELHQVYSENEQLRQMMYDNFGSAIRQLDSN
jgi:uncharacterized membrane-anchored protein YhcB (DUF1043 family)